MKPAALCLFLALTAGAAGAEFSTPRFTDPARREKLTAVFPAVDDEFRAYAAAKKFPGLVWGVVLDGELVHQGALGFADAERKIPAAADTRFRIASMTKSFTALAILLLRDAGKLTLDDPVTRHVPDFARVALPTSDAPPITIRHLLTMAAGFPEDNPWGDRQLAVSPADFAAFLRGGVSFSNAPGLAYEYSNVGYTLLGDIVTRVSGQPYQRFITEKVLLPLGMKQTVWEFDEVPAGKLALGYRSVGETWQLEPLLHDGAYGAMGGLLTTLEDFAHYTRLHLAAWPARDGPEILLTRRATLREMHQPGIISGLSTNPTDLPGAPAASVAGYAFGLRWAMDGKGVVNVGHSGGLPGFGSNWRFYPEHGLAVISFANLTYAGASAINAKIGDMLIARAPLARRATPPSAILAARAAQVAQLVQTWDAALADKIVAENFFPDRSLAAWRTLARETLAKAGAIKSVGAIVPENQLRGTFRLVGERGHVNVFFTLTPEKDPRVQQLRLTFVAAP